MLPVQTGSHNAKVSRCTYATASLFLFHFPFALSESDFPRRLFSTEKLRGIVVKIITKKKRTKRNGNKNLLCHKSWNASAWLPWYKESLYQRHECFIVQNGSTDYVPIILFTLQSIDFLLLCNKVWRNWGDWERKWAYTNLALWCIVSKRKSLTHRSTQIPSGKIPLRKSKKVCLVHGPRLFSFSKKQAINCHLNEISVFAAFAPSNVQRLAVWWSLCFIRIITSVS